MTENKILPEAATKLVEKKAVEKKAVRAVKTFAPAIESIATDRTDKKLKKEKKTEVKVKVVRDSFTMPQVDYDLIAEIKQKALSGGIHLKKSELLRAGLQALSKLSTAQLKLTVANLEKIKTGRPKKT